MKKEKEEFYLIYEDGDPLRAELVKSVLDEAGIACYIKNADVQNLFGMGSIGGINPLLGTVKVFVRLEDRVLAESTLARSQMPEQTHPELVPEDAAEDPAEEPAPQGKGFLALLRKWILG
ncbi:MAG TPA: DUF2007 domain-containing protein [Verrucomicrobiae bacterium]|jgi:hypothetical protein|nr:DUF2007 domain-containing protein [Verrucomicrobiae bacterium]